MKKITAILIALFTLLTAIIPFSAYADPDGEITFDPNGGTGGPGVVSIIGGQLLIPEEVPEKDGMIFRGWSLSQDDAAKGIIAYSFAGDLGGEDTYYGEAGETLYAAWAYGVLLHHGSNGWGTEYYPLYKFPAVDLPLLHTKTDIKAVYMMNPGANNVTTNQMSFIEWNTEQNDNRKGIGDAYRTAYTKNESAVLYCIWGYPIQYNADGGTFPANGSDIWLRYVCGYNGTNYNDPITLYGNFDFPDGDNTPTKEGCRLVTYDGGRIFVILRYSNGRVCTYESARQNLTIPPLVTQYEIVPSGLDWTSFHTTTDANGNLAVEFHFVFEPSITYKAGTGATGNDFSDGFLEWNGDYLHLFKPYTVKSAAAAGSGFSRPNCEISGWNTKADGTGTSYAPGSVITQLSTSDPLVLYAQWKSKCIQHIWSNWETVTEPGCTTSGHRTRICSVCLEEDSEILDPAGHSFGDYTTVTEPDCTNKGLERRHCPICGTDDDRDIPALGHDYTGVDYIVVKEPTYVSKGLKTRECNRCHEDDDVTIDVYPWENPFNDVSDNDWFYNAVAWANDNDIVDGISPDKFAPDILTNRAMVVTLLGRLNGIDDNSYPASLPFSDTPLNTWYSAHIAWASENNVVNGYEDGTFLPSRLITRQELAQLFYNYVSDFKDYDVISDIDSTALDSFTDKDKVAPWAKDAMIWAVSVGLINGAGNQLLPGSTAPRSQIVQLFYNYVNVVQPKLVPLEPILLGDIVRMAPCAPVYGTNTVFSDWVYLSNLYVREINGTRIVVSTEAVGDITGAVDRKYLTKI